MLADILRTDAVVLVPRVFPWLPLRAHGRRAGDVEAYMLAYFQFRNTPLFFSAILPN